MENYFQKVHCYCRDGIPTGVDDNYKLYIKLMEMKFVMTSLIVDNNSEIVR